MIAVHEIHLPKQDSGILKSDGEKEYDFITKMPIIQVLCAIFDDKIKCFTGSERSHSSLIGFGGFISGSPLVWPSSPYLY